jgi:uncharacterized membrane protein YfhO
MADGKPLPVTRANYNLIGMALPAGAKTIQLRFRDPEYGTGKMITLISLALAVIAAAMGFVLEGRAVGSTRVAAVGG